MLDSQLMKIHPKYLAPWPVKPMLSASHRMPNIISSIQRNLGNKYLQATGTWYRLGNAAPNWESLGVRDSNNSTGYGIQAKLTVSTPSDIYEQEADCVAEQIMRMPDSTGRTQNVLPQAYDNIKRNENKEKSLSVTMPQYIQRQPSDTAEPSSSEFKLPKSGLWKPSSGPDYLSLREPFVSRGVGHLWNSDLALRVWNLNFNFFRQFGVSPDLSVTFSNLTAPRLIDAQLKADNPTWWEITDRELKTSTLSVSIPLLEFNADFSPAAPSWLKKIFRSSDPSVQKKDMRSQSKENETSLSTETDAMETRPANFLENYVQG